MKILMVSLFMYRRVRKGQKYYIDKVFILTKCQMYNCTKYTQYEIIKDHLFTNVLL